MSADRRPLRILALPSWYPDDAHPTYGIFNRVQAEALAQRHSLVLAPVPRTVSLFRSSGSWRDRVHHSTTPRGLRELHLSGPNYTPRFPGAYQRVLWRLYRRAYREASRLFGAPPELIHAHAAVPAGSYGARLAALHDCPLVLTEHISRPELYLRDPRDRALFFHAMGAADLVMAVGPVQRELLHEAGIEREIDVVPNLVDTDFFQPGRPASGPPVRLLGVGHLVERKGFHHLLDALGALLRDGLPLTLDLVGEGPRREALLEQATRLGIRPLVCLHGQRSQSEVRELLRSSHIYVAPSLTESFGVAIIEAMSVGLPVVVTRSGGPEAFVRPEHGALVAPDSAEDLARGIRDVVERLDRIDPLEQRKVVLERFSESVVVEEITRRYQRVLARRCGG